MNILNQSQISAVSGGHGTELGILFVLSLPHMIIGTIEFYNYIGDKIVNGWLSDPNDYFAQNVYDIITAPAKLWDKATHEKS